jgi:hypothetical protein
LARRSSFAWWISLTFFNVQAQLSYGQLAAQSVIPLYNNFSGMLPTLTNTTQPGNVSFSCFPGSRVLR